MNKKVYTSRQWLYLKYVTQRKTEQEIAEEAGVDQATISRWLEKHEIARRRRA